MNIELTKSLHIQESCGHQRVFFAPRLTQWMAILQLKLQIRRERRELAALPSCLLDDIGIDKSAARRESLRSFSDIPAERYEGCADE